MGHPHSASRAATAAGLVLWVLAATVTAEPVRYRVEPERSRLRIELRRAGLLKMLGHDHTLEAPLAEGSIEADSSDVGLSRVTLRFEARRLAVVPGTEPEKDVPEVEARMRGPEVLDVERHPSITFSSQAVLAAGAPASGGTTARVRGSLELRGRATAIEAPVEVHLSAGGLVARGTLELNLRDLGVEPPSVAGVVKVANRFKVSFEIHARQVDHPPPNE